jgi:hypothetical protein
LSGYRAAVITHDSESRPETNQTASPHPGRPSDVLAALDGSY